MLRLAKDQLTIFRKGEEVPGLIAFGLRPNSSGSSPHFPAATWPTGTTLDEHFYEYSRSHVVVWRIGLQSWPPPHQWSSSLVATLDSLLDAGSVVSWIGRGEGCYCDPPSLFDQSCMSGCVLAAKTSQLSIVEEFSPYAPLYSLGDSDLSRLRQVCGELCSD